MVDVDVTDFELEQYQLHVLQAAARPGTCMSTRAPSWSAWADYTDDKG